MNGGRAALSLAARELIRFIRKPSRIIASVGTPLLVWVFLAGGFAGVRTGSMDAESAGGFGAFSLPGMVLLVAMFTSIFASISLITDRNEGFLRVVLASPAPRWTIVASKLGAGVLLAVAQSLLLLLIAPLVGPTPGLAGWACAVFGIACGAAACVGLGLGLAWWINSPEGFHGVMNLVLMPLWLLSGAFTPPEGAAGWFGAIVRANPLSAMLRVIRAGLTPGEMPVAIDVGLSLAFAVGAIAFAWVVMTLGAPPRHQNARRARAG